MSNRPCNAIGTRFASDPEGSGAAGPLLGAARPALRCPAVAPVPGLLSCLRMFPRGRYAFLADHGIPAAETAANMRRCVCFEAFHFLAQLQRPGAVLIKALVLSQQMPPVVFRAGTEGRDWTLRKDPLPLFSADEHGRGECPAVFSGVICRDWRESSPTYRHWSRTAEHRTGRFCSHRPWAGPA